MDGDQEAELSGWRRLAGAILLQAWRDCFSTNGRKRCLEAGIDPVIGLAGDARTFLQSDGAAWLVLALDLPAGGLDHALAGLPPPTWIQLAFDV